MHFQHVTRRALWEHYLRQGVEMKVVVRSEAERIATQREVDAVAAAIGVESPAVVIGMSEEDEEFAKKFPVKARYKTCGEG